MKTLIVYDSYYGNTRKIAELIKEVLGSDTEMIRAKDFSIDKMNYIDTLIVGSPTRIFKPTHNIMKFLHNFPNDILEDKNILLYDTRICLKDIPSNILKFFVKKFGYAIDNMEKIIEKKGGKISLQSQGFIIKENADSLYESEIERAKEWAKRFLNKIAKLEKEEKEKEEELRQKEEKFQKENKI